MNTQNKAIARLKACAEYMANKNQWQASANAPETFKNVKGSYLATKTIHVWNGASENTIFGDSEGNIHFRVWHDATHIKLDVGFSPSNEYLVLLEQQKDYTQWRKNQGHFDFVDVTALELLRLEIYGQRVFYEKHKDYLEQQKAFGLAMYKQQIELMQNWSE